MSIKLSLIELGAIPSDLGNRPLFEDMLQTAILLEEWGYNRIWYAEHHNTANFISRAPEVIIPHIASKTSSIRLGSGSVLLNHYSPFKVAEVFTLLEEMFPGRIDMGIGRATTGPVSDLALQRNRSSLRTSNDSMPQLQELLSWLNGSFEGKHVFNDVKSHYGNKLPEFWLLGSSYWSASAAAQLGLNYTYAGFINPEQAYDNFQIYKDNFKPSTSKVGKDKPNFILSLSIFCADTLEDAGRLAAPYIYMMNQVYRGNINAPIASEESAVAQLGAIPAQELINDYKKFPKNLIGTPLSLKKDIEAIAKVFQTGEIFIQCISNNTQNRLRSLKLLSEVFNLKN